MLLGEFGRRKGSKNRFRKPSDAYNQLKVLGINSLADDLVKLQGMDRDTASRYTLEAMNTTDQKILNSTFNYAMTKTDTLLSNLRDSRSTGEQVTLHTDISDYTEAIVTRITNTEIQFVYPEFNKLKKTILHLNKIIGVSRVIATIDTPIDDDEDDSYIEIF
jgi:hypothetical protein